MLNTSEDIISLYSNTNINVAVPTSATISNALLYSFDSQHLYSSGVLYINITDAEGGIHIAINGHDLGTLHYNNNQTFNFTKKIPYIKKGTNEIRIWSSSTDGATLINLSVNAGIKLNISRKGKVNRIIDKIKNLYEEYNVNTVEGTIGLPELPNKVGLKTKHAKSKLVELKTFVENQFNLFNCYEYNEEKVNLDSINILYENITNQLKNLNCYVCDLYSPCDCDMECYNFSCTCNQTEYGYSSCSCNNLCYQQSCLCNGVLYGGSCICYLIGVQSCMCDYASYDYCALDCGCDGSCYDYSNCTSGHYLCNCNGTCDTNNVCPCDWLADADVCDCYNSCNSGYSCPCNSSCDGYSCTCHNSDYGYSLCDCNYTRYVYSSCDCNQTCYNQSCNCNSSCDGYSSCDCVQTCHGYTCSCNSTCNSDSCDCYNSCFSANTPCQCYGSSDNGCTCYSGGDSVSGEICINCNAGYSCPCNSSCYGYSCDCNGLCYSDGCDSNISCSSNGCSCYSSNYGYSSCTCNSTCNSVTCGCNLKCYGYSCSCNGTCDGYSSCDCNSLKFGYTACTCDSTCNSEPCSCDGSCNSGYSCVCNQLCDGDTSCFGYSDLICDCNGSNYIINCDCEGSYSGELCGCYGKRYGLDYQCDILCYSYTPCSCDNTCYDYSCNCNFSCDGYSSCDCDSRCHQDTCDCYSTNYGLDCLHCYSSNYSCDNFSFDCLCDSVCDEYSLCPTDNTCSNFSPCDCYSACNQDNNIASCSNVNCSCNSGGNPNCPLDYGCELNTGTSCNLNTGTVCCPLNSNPLNSGDTTAVCTNDGGNYCEQHSNITCDTYSCDAYN